MYLNLGLLFIRPDPYYDDSEGVSSSESESQQDMSNSQSEREHNVPDLNDLPELDSPHDSSEGTEERESGIDPRTTEIIQIIRDGQEIVGRPEDKSAWVRQQFDQLMVTARQDVNTELDRDGVSDPIERTERIQAQLDSYLNITMDRLEYSDPECFDPRDWQDLQSNSELGSESPEPQPQQPNEITMLEAGESETIPAEAVPSEQETAPAEAVPSEQETASAEAVASEQETSLPSNRKRALSEDSSDEPSPKRVKETESSLLDDYADTSTEMPSYTDPED